MSHRGDPLACHIDEAQEHDALRSDDLATESKLIASEPDHYARCGQCGFLMDLSNEEHVGCLCDDPLPVDAYWRGECGDYSEVES